MVLSIGVDGDAAYYIECQADYYTKGHEPKGQWYTPDGHFGLQDGGDIDNDVFALLMDGVSPDGEKIGRDPKDASKTRVSSYDLTFSVSKSVSILWAVSDSQMRARIEEIFDRSVRRTLEVAQDHTAFFRRGRNGAELVKTRFFGALFQHGESRPMENEDQVVVADMQLHKHSVIFNLAQDEVGKWYALDPKNIMDWKMALGATQHAELARLLEMELGCRIRIVGNNGEFEIVGVRQDLLDHFSRRRAQIEESLKAMGLSTADAPQLAAAMARVTRKSKLDNDYAGEGHERFDRWAEEVLALGFTQADVLACFFNPLGEQELQDREKEFEDALKTLVKDVTETNAVIERRDVHRHIAALCAAHGRGADDIEQLVDRFINKTEAPGDLFEWDGERFEHYVKEREAEDRLVSLPNLKDKGRRAMLTSPDLLRAERGIFEIAGDFSNDRRHIVPFHEVEAALARLQAAAAADPENVKAPTPEQENAIRYSTTHPGLVCCMEGAAGAGKSVTLKHITSIYRDILGPALGVDYRVIGCSAKWLTVRAMIKDADLEDEDARAAAKWIHDIREGKEQIDERTVLLVDEAGQMGSRDMYELLKMFTAAGAKVILTGDRAQQRSVGAGPAMDIVASRIGSLRLERTQRMAPQADDVLLHTEGLSRADAIGRVYGMTRTRKDILVNGASTILRDEVKARFTDAAYTISPEERLIWIYGMTAREAQRTLSTLNPKQLRDVNSRAVADEARKAALDWAADVATDINPELIFAYLEDQTWTVAARRASELSESDRFALLYGHASLVREAMKAWALSNTIPTRADAMVWIDGISRRSAEAFETAVNPARKKDQTDDRSGAQDAAERREGEARARPAEEGSGDGGREDAGPGPDGTVGRGDNSGNGLLAPADQLDAQYAAEFGRPAAGRGLLDLSLGSLAYPWEDSSSPLSTDAPAYVVSEGAGIDPDVRRAGDRRGDEEGAGRGRELEQPVALGHTAADLSTISLGADLTIVLPHKQASAQPDDTSAEIDPSVLAGQPTALLTSLRRHSELVPSAGRAALTKGRVLAFANDPTSKVKAEDVLYWVRGKSWTEAFATTEGMTPLQRRMEVAAHGATAVRKSDGWANNPQATITAKDVLIHVFGFNGEEAERRASAMPESNQARLVERHWREVRDEGQIWTRLAATDFSYGPTDPKRTMRALRAFEDHGRLHWSKTHFQALQKAIDGWKRFVTHARPGDTAVVLAKSNADVRSLNVGMRAYQRQRGLLGDEEFVVSTVSRFRQGKKQLEVELPIAVGEQLLFTHRDDKLGVVNGTMGKVLSMARSAHKGHAILTVELASDGRTITFDTADYTDGAERFGKTKKGKKIQFRPGRSYLEHSYATTTFSAQGMTRTVAFAQVDSSQKSNAVYVAASRATGETHLYASEESENAFLAAGLTLKERKDAVFSHRDRMRSLAAHLSRAQFQGSVHDAFRGSNWRELIVTERAEGLYDQTDLEWRQLTPEDLGILFADVSGYVPEHLLDENGNPIEDDRIYDHDPTAPTPFEAGDEMPAWLNDAPLPDTMEEPAPYYDDETSVSDPPAPSRSSPPPSPAASNSRPGPVVDTFIPSAGAAAFSSRTTNWASRTCAASFHAPSENVIFSDMASFTEHPMPPATNTKKQFDANNILPKGDRARRGGGGQRHWKYDNEQINREMELLVHGDSSVDFEAMLKKDGWRVYSKGNNNTYWTKSSRQRPSSSEILSITVKDHHWVWTTENATDQGGLYKWLTNYAGSNAFPSIRTERIKAWLELREYISGAGPLIEGTETAEQRKEREARQEAARREAEARAAREADAERERIRKETAQTHAAAAKLWGRQVALSDTATPNLLERRGITRETQRLYADTVRFDRAGKMAAFLHTTATGAISGFERKYEGGGNIFTDGLNAKSIAIFGDQAADIRRIVITETGVDAMSKAQLDDCPADTLCVSSGGDPGTVSREDSQAGQAMLALAARYPGALIEIATDRDTGGNRQAEKWQGLLADHPGGVRRVVTGFVNDWNNVLRFDDPAMFTPAMYRKDLRKADPILPPPPVSRPDLMPEWRAYEAARPMLEEVYRTLAREIGAWDDATNTVQERLWADHPLAKELWKSIHEGISSTTTLSQAIENAVGRYVGPWSAWERQKDRLAEIESKLQSRLAWDADRERVDSGRWEECGGTAYMRIIARQIQNTGATLPEAIKAALTEVDRQNTLRRDRQHEGGERNWSEVRRQIERGLAHMETEPERYALPAPDSAGIPALLAMRVLAERNTPRQQVYEDIASRLRATSMPETEIRGNAALVAARYDARAARLRGAAGDALAMYQAEGIEIQTVTAFDDSAAGENQFHQSAAPFRRFNIARAERRFSAALRQMFDGTSSVAAFHLGETPPVLQALGLENIDVLMTQSVVRKALASKPDASSDALDSKTSSEGKHNQRVSPENVSDVIRAICDPLAVFVDDPSHGQGRVVVITDMVGRNGDPIAVVVAPHGQFFSKPANYVPTIHERTQPMGELLYSRDAEVLARLPRSWTKSPRGAGSTQSSAAPNVVTRADVVNLYGTVLWQSTGSETAPIRRGTIDIGHGHSQITLLQSDRSTFMHEMSHQWLVEMARDVAHPNAPQDLKDDWQTVMNWLGVRSASEIDTPHHEQWAQGFEQYLLDGRSPEQGLSHVFDDFGTWMTDIYQTAEAFDVPITDEIRGVMDRIVSRYAVMQGQTRRASSQAQAVAREEDTAPFARAAALEGSDPSATRKSSAAASSSEPVFIDQSTDEEIPEGAYLMSDDPAASDRILADSEEAVRTQNSSNNQSPSAPSIAAEELRRHEEEEEQKRRQDWNDQVLDADAKDRKDGVSSDTVAPIPGRVMVGEKVGPDGSTPEKQRHQYLQLLCDWYENPFDARFEQDLKDAQVALGKNNDEVKIELRDGSTIRDDGRKILVDSKASPEKADLIIAIAAAKGLDDVYLQGSDEFRLALAKACFEHGITIKNKNRAIDRYLTTLENRFPEKKGMYRRDAAVMDAQNKQEERQQRQGRQAEQVAERAARAEERTSGEQPAGPSIAEVVAEAVTAAAIEVPAAAAAEVPEPTEPVSPAPSPDTPESAVPAAEAIEPAAAEEPTQFQSPVANSLDVAARRALDEAAPVVERVTSLMDFYKLLNDAAPAIKALQTSYLEKGVAVQEQGERAADEQEDARNRLEQVLTKHYPEPTAILEQVRTAEPVQIADWSASPPFLDPVGAIVEGPADDMMIRQSPEVTAALRDYGRTLFKEAESKLTLAQMTENFRGDPNAARALEAQDALRALEPTGDPERARVQLTELGDRLIDQINQSDLDAVEDPEVRRALSDWKQARALAQSAYEHSKAQNGSSNTVEARYGNFMQMVHMSATAQDLATTHGGPSSLTGAVALTAQTKIADVAASMAHELRAEMEQDPAVRQYVAEHDQQDLLATYAPTPEMSSYEMGA